MSSRIAVLLLLLSLCCSTGVGQTRAPAMLVDTDSRPVRQIRVSDDLRREILLTIRDFDQRVSVTEDRLNQLARGVHYLSVPNCLLQYWLTVAKGAPGYTDASLDQILLDRLRDHAGVVRSIESDLAKKMSAQGKVNEDVQRHIASLSRSIAANETSLTHIREEVLPEIDRQVDINRRKISDNYALIRVIHAEYTAQMKSICDRLADHDERIRSLEQKPQVSVLRSPIPSHVGTEGRSQVQAVTYVEIPYQPYHPNIILRNIRYLCSSAQLVASGYRYVSPDSESGRTVIRRYFGDLYQNCNGEFVLIQR